MSAEDRKLIKRNVKIDPPPSPHPTPTLTWKDYLLWKCFVGSNKNEKFEDLDCTLETEE